MKAVIAKSDLSALVSKIQTIVSTKPAIPILSNILIEAIDGQLILHATDMTTSMKCFAEAKVIEEGAIALPARSFFQLVKELTASQIKISTANDIAEITAGASLFKINGFNSELFPAIPTHAGAQQIPIDASLLKEMLSKTAFSVAHGDSRLVLNGIHLKIANQQGSLISTDGKRVSKVSTQLDIDPSFQGSYVLPLKAVDEMIKNLSEEKTTAQVSLTPDKVFLEHKNVLLSAKLLSGQYPDVEEVIPDEHPIHLSLHREELITLLRQVALFTSEDTSSVKFCFEEGQLHLFATSSDIGEGTVSMPVDYRGEKMKIAFNPQYFIDILRHSKDETVTFSFKDPFNPGLITDTSNALFLIMPMRLFEPTEEKPQEDDSKKPVFA